MAGEGKLSNSSKYFFCPKQYKISCIFYDVTRSGEFDIITLTANV